MDRILVVASPKLDLIACSNGAKALRKLKHPSRSKQLKSFLES